HTALLAHACCMLHMTIARGEWPLVDKLPVSEVLLRLLLFFLLRYRLRELDGLVMMPSGFSFVRGRQLLRSSQDSSLLQIQLFECLVGADRPRGSQSVEDCRRLTSPIL